jgi:hypothetical protein
MRNKLFSSLFLAFLFATLYPLQAQSQTDYSNKANKQKLITQLKAAVEAVSTDFAAYKGAAMKDTATDFDYSDMNLFASKKPFVMSSLAAVACPKEGTGNELYLELDGFESDEAAVEFGESIITSLKGLTYSFGKLLGAASGADAILMLEVNKGKNVPKSFQGLKIFIEVPPGDFGPRTKKINIRILKLDF